MRNLRKALNFSFILLAFIAILSSCGKEDPITTDNDPIDNPTSTENFSNYVLNLSGGNPSEVDTDCADLVYPVTINVPNSGSQVANNDDEFWTIIEDYFEEYGDDVDEYPTLQFPVDVILEDGTTQTVNDEEGLSEIFDDCYDNEDYDGWEEDCFELVYPITLELNDGSTVTVNSDDELQEAFESYDFELAFVFPITVVFDDNDMPQTIDNEAALEELIEECEDEYDNDEGDWEEDCFEFVYPVSLELLDGSIVTANNEDELEEIFDSYDFEPAFVFPISVILDDNDMPQTIANEAELEELFESCDDEFDCDWDEDCFELVYPISLELEDGTIVTANSDDELEEIFDSYDFEPAIVFPISVITEDSDQPITINNMDEFEELIESCEGDDDWDDDCFEFVYPISLELEDGTTVTANNEDELEEIFDSYDFEVEFVYPFDIILEDGTQTTINNEDELDEVIEDC